MSEHSTYRTHEKTGNLVKCYVKQLGRLHVLHGEVWLTPQETCLAVSWCAVLYNIYKERNTEALDDDGGYDGR